MRAAWLSATRRTGGIVVAPRRSLSSGVRSGGAGSSGSLVESSSPSVAVPGSDGDGAWVGSTAVGGVTGGTRSFSWGAADGRDVVCDSAGRAGAPAGAWRGVSELLGVAGLTTVGVCRDGTGGLGKESAGGVVLMGSACVGAELAGRIERLVAGGIVREPGRERAAGVVLVVAGRVGRAGSCRGAAISASAAKGILRLATGCGDVRPPASLWLSGFGPAASGGDTPASCRARKSSSCSSRESSVRRCATAAIFAEW